MEKLIALLIILICTVRVVSYGIYTVKEKNKIGAAGMFIMAILVAVCSVYFFMQ